MAVELVGRAGARGAGLRGRTSGENGDKATRKPPGTTFRVLSRSLKTFLTSSLTTSPTYFPWSYPTPCCFSDALGSRPQRPSCLPIRPPHHTSCRYLRWSLISLRVTFPTMLSKIVAPPCCFNLTFLHSPYKLLLCCELIVLLVV